jgi:acetylornithine deacetylase
MINSYLKQEAISLLKNLISTKSFSKQEDSSATKIDHFLKGFGVPTNRKFNNVWALNKNFKENLPTLMLNSHHDTVHPNSSWKHDPFKPVIENQKLFGLGSNDAGGALVSLIATFLHFYQQKNLNFNLILTATAEEENSGYQGIESILAEIGKIDMVIVGEPTEMKMAIAEKGLVVLDCVAKGKAGHAARSGGINAIDEAIRDIQWFHSYKFPNESVLLGPIRMTVTIIQAGTQHNIIPDNCRFTVDVRSTDAYSNEEIIEIVKKYVNCEVVPRSIRLRPSKIAKDHPLVRAAENISISLFGSPTTSDQAVLPFPSVKIGPGDSNRSHTADEFIYLREIKQGIDIYVKLLENLNNLI